MVADQMLQAFTLNGRSRAGRGEGRHAGVGYLAYGRTERSDRAADWWMKWRLSMTRVLLLVGWVGGLYWQISAWIKVRDYLNKDGALDRDIGRSLFWTRKWSTEFMRMLGGALVAFFSMLIVMQDWDFPDFTGEDTKITAVDFEAIHLSLPAWCYSLPALYISSKWFNYFGVLTGVAFD